MRKKRLVTQWRQISRKVFKLLPTTLAHICPGLLLVALACAACSCSCIDTHTKQYAGAPQQPPTQPANVRILRFEPTQPTQQLGEIVLIIPPDFPQSKEQVDDRLRQEAAKLGADAVVVVDDHMQPYGADFKYEWHLVADYDNAEKLVAKALKYETLPVTGRTQ
jgi:hypothetical protein